MEQGVTWPNLLVWDQVRSRQITELHIYPRNWEEKETCDNSEVLDMEKSNGRDMETGLLQTNLDEYPEIREEDLTK